ncbi:Hsp70 family protein-like protein [Dactylonectria estremocensis]|uniref:Hsp70 family protein-like protein n=1 Tax=Dactylonectria estremocensis TaxID=1079267 RepID=A0A9P9EHX8_9HYPO|nr:Hsp70 family protein-like protein [Dactylonectria estremocensis]
MNEPLTYDAQEKVIIALDFGTTFSGIAFCFADQAEPSVTSIQNWPGAEGRSAPKVPTLINYDPSDKNTFTWGASIGWMNQSESVVGVKLLLDPSQQMPHYLKITNVKRDIKKLPKPPVHIACDYIGAMYKHALSEMTKAVTADYLAICQKQFVLSVPAVWSDAAKNATLMAAKMAGLHPVSLIKEPEAAALYTLQSLNFSLKEGNVFVLCDAGGGTVDLISYQVEAVLPRLQLKELVSGKGGMAGSIGLNKRFREAVENLVGPDQWHELQKQKKALFQAEKQFETEVKAAFRGGESEEYLINFPMVKIDDDAENGLSCNCWTMTGRDVKDIFSPIIDDILKFINEQVLEIRGIMLVGGFGGSQYLKTRVEKEHPNIQILQPAEAWAAIVRDLRGAALSKMPRKAEVVSVCSDRHLGVEAMCPFDPMLDKDQPTSMTWYIYKDEDLRRDQTIKFPFFRTIEQAYNPQDLIFCDTLWECGDRVAPDHRCKGEKIKSNCVVTSDLREIDASNFTRKMVHYDLVISVASANLNFSLEVKGKAMGSMQVQY